MDEEIELGDYSAERGLRLAWQPGYELRVVADAREVLISGNAAGLCSMAQHLLTLAQAYVPPGVHAHLEPGLELEEDSVSLIVEKSR